MSNICSMLKALIFFSLGERILFFHLFCFSPQVLERFLSWMHRVGLPAYTADRILLFWRRRRTQKQSCRYRLTLLLVRIALPTMHAMRSSSFLRATGSSMLACSCLPCLRSLWGECCPPVELELYCWVCVLLASFACARGDLELSWDPV